MTERKLQAREEERNRQRWKERRETVSNRDAGTEDTDCLPIRMVQMGKNLPTVLSISCADMMSSSIALRSRPLGWKVPLGIDLRSA